MKNKILALDRLPKKGGTFENKNRGERKHPRRLDIKFSTQTDEIKSILEQISRYPFLITRGSCDRKADQYIHPWEFPPRPPVRERDL